jgi:hypothetical protein
MSVSSDVQLPPLKIRSAKTSLWLGSRLNYCGAALGRPRRNRARGWPLCGVAPTPARLGLGPTAARSAPQRSERPSVALPCDQFGHQEPESDAEIATFCRRTAPSAARGSFLEFFSRNWLKAKWRSPANE